MRFVTGQSARQLGGGALRRRTGQAVCLVAGWIALAPSVSCAELIPADYAQRVASYAELSEAGFDVACDSLWGGWASGTGAGPATTEPPAPAEPREPQIDKFRLICAAGADTGAGTSAPTGDTDGGAPGLREPSLCVAPQTASERLPPFEIHLPPMPPGLDLLDPPKSPA